jgi:threonine dehydrogenase-like Zn-dependent dehydrogenase
MEVGWPVAALLSNVGGHDPILRTGFAGACCAMRWVSPNRLGHRAAAVDSRRIGLAVIAVLKMKGVSPIVASEFSPERRALAQRLGADVVVDPRETSPFEALITAAATDDPARMAASTAVLDQLRLRPTVAFECVGVPGLIQQLIGGVPAGSRIVVAGINTGSDNFEPAQGILKELDIRFSLYYTPEEFGQTFAHLAAGELDAAALLTGSVGLDGVADAFERLGNSPSEAKILLDPSR